MLKTIRHCYTQWDHELMEVMLDPAKAEHVRPGYRRAWARQVAALGPIERRQLYDFSKRWQRAPVGKASLIALAILAGCSWLIYLARPAIPFGATLAVVSCSAIGLGVALMGVWFNHRKIIKNMVRTLAAVILFTLLGIAGGVAGTAYGHGISLRQAFSASSWTMIQLTLGVGLAYGLLLLSVAAWRNAGYEKIALQLHAEAEQEKMARQLGEAQLRLLHAQIEPHFLFNTLGAVRELAERERAFGAAELTANLIAFLRTTSSRVLQEQSSLREEFELANAYLQVMKTRLGDRLRIQVELAEDLGALEVPSMSVLTLAENAVKHGAEPSRSPTTIRVLARRDGDKAVVQVADSGVGLGEGASGGSGLRNLRDRLRLAFGSGAGVVLYEQDGGGVVAEMTLPAEPGPDSGLGQAQPQGAQA